MNNLHLVLFFSRGISLQIWDQIGILDREIRLYHQLLPYTQKITFVTYGDEQDQNYQEKLNGIQVLCNHWKLPTYLYSLLVPWLHRKELSQATILKTNQIRGSETALLAKNIFQKPLIVRSGYVWSQRDKTLPNVGSWRTIQQAELTERIVYTQGEAAVVPTQSLKSYIGKQYGLPETKICIIPNYVDTIQFSPIWIHSNSAAISSNLLRLIFVGRLAEEKNLSTLIQAIKGLNVSLTIVGDGPLRQELAILVDQNRVNVVFTGRIPNHQLPDELRKADCFVLPSLWEGHPKALVEAMAIGLAPIASNMDGNRDVIRHEETGLLCSPTVEGIRTAIQRLLDDRCLRQRLGRAAHHFVVENYSLEHIVQTELELLQRVQNEYYD